MLSILEIYLHKMFFPIKTIFIDILISVNLNLIVVMYSLKLLRLLNFKCFILLCSFAKILKLGGFSGLNLKSQS